MIHRRLLDDDAFGVDQPLNETEFGGKGLVARGTHYLLFDPNMEDQLVRTRLLAKSIFASPIVTLNNQEEGTEIVQTSPGSYQLPANVHLLTLAIIPETEQVRILNLITISIPFLTRIEWNSWYLTSTFV